MAAVAQSHAVEVSCPIVRREFFLWPVESRRLFGGIDLDATPETESGAAAIKNKLAGLHAKLFGLTAAVDSLDVEEAYQMFVEVWNRKQESEGERFPGRMNCSVWGDHLYFEGIADDALTYDNQGRSRLEWDIIRDLAFSEMHDPNHVARTWVVTLAFLLTDYRYLYF